MQQCLLILKIEMKIKNRRNKKQNIKFKRQNKKNEWKRKKNKNVDETLKIIEKILDYNKNTQKFFYRASRIDKRKSKPKIEESFAERVKFKNNKIAEIKKEEKNINNLLFKYYFTNYRNASDFYKKLRETKDKRNEDQVYSIQEVLNKRKGKIKNRDIIRYTWRKRKDN